VTVRHCCQVPEGFVCNLMKKNSAKFGTKIPHLCYFVISAYSKRKVNIDSVFIFLKFVVVLAHIRKYTLPKTVFRT
jgi:hypothetical protein